MDKIKDYLPLASAFCLILGALRLIFFYSFFGIDILSYIDLTEILTLSFSFLVNSSFITLAFLIMFIPAINDSQISGVPDKKLGAVGWLMITAFIVYYMFNTYDVFGNYIVDFRISYDTLALFAIIIFIAGFTGSILSVIRKRALYLFSYDIDNNMGAVLLLTIGICALCVLQSRNLARDILLKRKPEYVEIKLDSTVIKSSYDYRFIGKTKGYVFFYNIKNNVADVYSTDGEKDRKMSFPNTLPSLQIGGMRQASKEK